MEMEMQLDGEPTCIVPGEILYFILSLLPARYLLLARATSRDWAETIDCLLRARLCLFDSDITTEIVFESIPPSEFRSAGRQVIRLSEFLNGSNKLAKDIAIFKVPGKTTHILPLDDEEAFGSMLLSLHLQGVDKSKPTPVVEEEDAPAVGTGPRPIAMTMSAVGIPPPIANPFNSPPARPNPAFTFSLTLAEGLERLYRSWFEITPSGCAGSSFDLEKELAHLQFNSANNMEMEDDSGTAVDSFIQPRTQPQILKPSGACALLQAHIQCYQIKPTRKLEGSSYLYSSYGSPNYIPTQPQMFEFFYTHLYLEVGKVVVSIEEGKRNFENKSRFVFMMRNGA